MVSAAPDRTNLIVYQTVRLSVGTQVGAEFFVVVNEKPGHLCCMVLENLSMATRKARGNGKE
jgi:hypothetical protein